MILAAGILIQDRDRNCLFVKRGDGGDHPGEWSAPGGRMESFDHGSAEACAIRETLEEIGFDASALQLYDLTRTITKASESPTPMTDDVDYETFLLKVDEAFSPTLSDEHVAYAWALPESPPEPLHPGCAIALARLSMNELDVARTMATGGLVSPQRYQNMWLFAMRITGTGMAYRVHLKEHVWRDPSLYLNDEFLSRCNGLAVIMEHPESATLNSAEFADRIVGSILLPYIKDDEVWGIAKIYDDAAIQMMRSGPLSTSPAVVFRGSDNGTKLELESGEHLFIEGQPTLLDHLAICEQGVWDKGGNPSGISVNDSIGERQVMTEAEEREDKARKDAEASEKAAADKARKDSEDRMDAVADRILTKLDSFEKRMDAMESADKERADKARKDSEEKEAREDKARKDAEEKAEKGTEAERTAADKARKDAEEKEAEEKACADKARKDEEEKAEKEEREDAARKDSVQARLADLEKAMPKPRDEDEHRSFADAQSRADRVYGAYSQRAPRPMDGEDLNSYRRRLLKPMQAHSPSWKDINLHSVADAAAFEKIEEQVYADAVKTSRSLDDIPEGQMREEVHTDSTGRRITDFHGHPRAWMQAFGGHRRRLVGIRQEGHI